VSDDPERVEAETELATHRIAEYVRRILAKAPPLSDAQRQRIVGLLSPNASHAIGGQT
jgi:hypothetical protein